MTSLGESRSELDAITADIELTLVSIIQGVALTVLIETSREVIAKLDWMMWPYVLSGLLIILVFWSLASGKTSQEPALGCHTATWAASNAALSRVRGVVRAVAAPRGRSPRAGRA